MLEGNWQESKEQVVYLSLSRPSDLKPFLDLAYQSLGLPANAHPVKPELIQSVLRLSSYFDAECVSKVLLDGVKARLALPECTAEEGFSLVSSVEEQACILDLAIGDWDDQVFSLLRRHIYQVFILW